MRTIWPLFIALLALVSALCGPSCAQGSAAGKLAARMTNVLLRQSGTAAGPRRAGAAATVAEPSSTACLAFLNPGLTVPPPGTGAMAEAEDAYRLSLLVNPVIPRGVTFEETSVSVPSVFEFILNNKVRPVESISADDQRRLAAARAVVEDATDPTLRSARYRAYLRYKSLWVAAADALESAQADKREKGTPVPQTLVDAESKAREQWAALGYRKEVEDAFQVVERLSPRTAGFWVDALSSFNAGQRRSRDGITYWATAVYPSYSEWGSDGGWTTFRFDGETVSPGPNTAPRPSGASAVGGECPWTLNTKARQLLTGAPARTSSLGALGTALAGRAPSGGRLASSALAAVSTSAAQGNGLVITVKLKRVLIDRPWLASGIFRARNWALNRINKDVLISRGEANDVAVPEKMPQLVSGVLLAKDLKLIGRLSTAEVQFIQEAAKLLQTAPPGAALGFGPFALASKDAWGGGDATPRISDDGGITTVETPDMQILGYFCDVLPRCPDPDPALSFQD